MLWQSCSPSVLHSAGRGVLPLPAVVRLVVAAVLHSTAWRGWGVRTTQAAQSTGRWRPGLSILAAFIGWQWIMLTAGCRQSTSGGRASCWLTSNAARLASAKFAGRSRQSRMSAGHKFGRQLPH